MDYNQMSLEYTYNNFNIIYSDQEIFNRIKRDNIVSILDYRSHYTATHNAYAYMENGEELDFTVTYRELSKKAKSIATHLPRTS